MKLAVTLTLAPFLTHADPVVGLKDYSFAAPHHASEVTAVMWYPSTAGGEVEISAENAVFYGVETRRNGTLTGATMPVVLMSHGLGGNFRSLAWLSAGLAARGAVVVNMDHPNSTTFDFDMLKGLDHWTRAWDMSRALDQVLADPDLAGRIDETRIMAAGFSYGGWTALSLGGVTGSLSGEIAECAHQKERSTHFSDLKAAGIGFEQLDPDAWDASYKDARITHVAAMDPALHHGFTSENVAALEADTLLIALGDEDDRLVAANFDDSGFADLLPEAEVLRIAPAFHFSLLPLCKPGGVAILKEENDDPVCTDPTGADRAAIHKQVIDSIAAKLGL